MKALVLDPAELDKEVGKQVRALQTLGRDTEEAIDAMELKVKDMYYDWLFDYRSDLRERIEYGDFSKGEPEPKPKGSTKAKVKLRKK
ncbi:hypothetical protein [Vibrio mediterranei]|uniref:hypothetical protein n=1 Tax=Vibrio mediterranei TaxID=689 RepID=UPI00148DD487|nr:hypothetical protein [Vibrio mediterranei]NOH27865.1 hypothetical protein [Vibrio mediterranei]